MFILYTIITGLAIIGLMVAYELEKKKSFSKSTSKLGVKQFSFKFFLIAAFFLSIVSFICFLNIENFRESLERSGVLEHNCKEYEIDEKVIGYCEICGRRLWIAHVDFEGLDESEK